MKRNRFYGGGDHQDASGGRGSSVPEEERQAIVPGAEDH